MDGNEGDGFLFLIVVLVAIGIAIAVLLVQDYRRGDRKDDEDED